MKKTAILTICLIVFACTAQAATVNGCTDDANNPKIIDTINAFQGQTIILDVNARYNYEYPKGWTPDINDLKTSSQAILAVWNGPTYWPVAFNADYFWRDCYGELYNPDPNVGVNMTRQMIISIMQNAPEGVYIVQCSQGFKELETLTGIDDYTSKVGWLIKVEELKFFSPF
jgi:hypothetical protein